MRLLKSIYTGKSFMTFAAWLLLVVPLVAAGYVFLSSSGSIAQKQLIVFSALIVFSFVSLLFFSLVALSIEKKRAELIEGFYTRWASKVGIKPLDESHSGFSRQARRVVFLTWVGKTSKIDSIRLEGLSAMSPHNILEFLDEINNLAPKKKTFLLELNDMNDGEISAKLASEDNPKIVIVQTTLGVMSKIFPLLSERNSPSVQLADDYENQETNILKSFLLTEMSEIIPLRSHRDILQSIQEAVQAQEGFVWKLEQINDSVVLFKQVKDSGNQQNDEEIMALLWQSARASLKFAGSYAIAKTVDVLYMQNEVPLEFDVILSNADDLQDEETLKNFTKGFINILTSKFPGKWIYTSSLISGKVSFSKVS